MKSNRFSFGAIAALMLLGALPAQGQQNVQFVQFREPQVELDPSNDVLDSTTRNERPQQTTANTASQGVTVAEAIVRKLHKANEAEIQIAQLAQEMSDNKEVQQLATTLIQDHKAFNEKLERLQTTKWSRANNAANVVNRNASTSEARRQRNANPTGTLDARDDRPAANRSANLPVAGTPNQPNTSSENTTINATGERTPKPRTNLPVASTPNQPNTSGANTTINASGENTSNRENDLRTAGTPNADTTERPLSDTDRQPYQRDSSSMRSNPAASGSQMVPQQLCTIAEQACENATQMTEKMLRGYQGQDFNMAFLGQQCVAHTMMLAELKAIESAGPVELRSIASEAASKVQSHLDSAKRLAKKFEDDRSNASQRQLSDAS